MLKFLFFLLLTCVLSFIVTNKKEPFLFVKTLLYGTVFIILGYVSLAISVIILVFISLIFNIEENGNYFFVGIMLILLSAIIQLPLIKIIFHKIDVSIEEITVLEHFIQWTLVYFAIYQAFVENLKIDDIDFKNLHSIFLDPANLNIAFLPTLILTWITVFNYKMKV